MTVDDVRPAPIRLPNFSVAVHRGQDLGDLGFWMPMGIQKPGCPGLVATAGLATACIGPTYIINIDTVFYHQVNISRTRSIFMIPNAPIIQQT